jgi:hypothetical protein
MSTLDQIVAVTITSDSVTPTARGFGTTLILAHHNVFAERVREYATVTEMVSDGFSETTHYAILNMARAIKAQNPSPATFKVGRAAIGNAVAWRGELTITTATEGDVVSFTLVRPNGTEVDISYTVLAAATTTTVATAVELLTEAVTGLGSSSASAVVTLLGDNVGEHFYIKDLQNCTWKDTTADANLSTELDAISVYDNDWFYLATLIQSEANVDEVAAWAETAEKVYAFSTSDDVELSSSTLFTGLVSNGYEYTFPIFSRDQEGHAGAAVGGKFGPKQVGSWIAKFQRLKGVDPDTFTTTQRSYLENAARRANYIESTSNVIHLANGITPSGRHLDSVVGQVWFKARLQETVFDWLASADKREYTDKGFAELKAEIQSVCDRAVIAGYLHGGTADVDPDDDDYIPPPTITMLSLADIPAADRANRHVPDIKIAAREKGGIQSVGIEVTISV